MRKRTLLLVMALVAALLAAGASRPAPRPSDFSARVDNPWFPLKSGTMHPCGC